MGILNDRNQLKRLVENYGKEDVLNYVKHLNESIESDVINYIEYSLSFFVTDGYGGVDEYAYVKGCDVKMMMAFPKGILYIDVYVEDIEDLNNSFYVLFRFDKNNMTSIRLNNEVIDLFTNNKVIVNLHGNNKTIKNARFAFPEYNMDDWDDEYVRLTDDEGNPIIINYSLQNEISKLYNNDSVKSYNDESPEDFICKGIWHNSSVGHGEVERCLDLLNINLNSDKPINISQVDKITLREFIEEDGLMFCYNSVKDNGKIIDVIKLLKSYNVNILAKGNKTCIICYDDLPGKIEDILWNINAIIDLKDLN